MECTQRLECTQELFNYGSNCDRICPEQIGFLGICGTKYPIVKGPNKIGRDPQMCNIVINLNSVSRQHAVVNILNNKEFMLMDLDSANKTKLMDITLKPYIPHPLRNGDTVQFGDVFGIFRLLEENDDLPMTQAINIPDTPINTRQPSKLNTITTIPESPDVSDRDGSFLISTQFKEEPQFKTSNEHFIKPSSKIISIQPVGSKKIDNVFWHSSRKSKSLNLSLNNSRNSLNNTDSNINNKENNNIHEMDTQIPYSNPNDNSESIYEAQTQIPIEDHPLQSIHNIETQIPTNEHIPEVCKIPEQREMKLNLYTSTKETLVDIHEAETQYILPCENEKEIMDTNESVKENLSTEYSTNETKQKVNTSDEELLFNDITSQSFQDVFESQCLLPKISLSPKSNENVADNMKDESFIEKPIPKLRKGIARIESDSSTDCEDLEILPSQKLSENQTDDGDETDCEDILNENNLIKSKTESLANEIKIKVSPGKIVTKSNNIKTCKQNEVCFEDMLTQVVELEANDNNFQDEVDFEDLPTQVIDEVIPNNSECIEHTQQFSEEIISPFKIPIQSNNKVKIKHPSELVSNVSHKTRQGVIETVSDNYYPATQDIYDDLCSQKTLSANAGNNNDNLFKKPLGIDRLDITHSFQNDTTGITFGNIENKISKNSNIVGDCSKEDNENVKQFVSSLSKRQIRDVIGINSTSSRIPSDSSAESTPKKLKPSRLMDIELPNSQEIKASVNAVTKTSFTLLSSDSESENNSEEPYTPVLHRKKGKSKTNLANKLDLETLPTRIITRVRKQTAKIANSRKKAEIINKNILQPNFLTEHDDDIDKEIITENISRLKSEIKKTKSNSDKKSIDNKTKNSPKTLNKIETKDVKEKSKISHKKEQKSNSRDEKKIREIESENSTNETKSSRSVRSSKTRHKPESENKLVHNNENKEEVKSDSHDKSQITSNKNNITIEPSLFTSSGRTTRGSRNRDESDKNSVTSNKPDKEKPTRKPSQKKREKDNSRDEAVEIRRSTRQRTVKDKKENELPGPAIKSILKRPKNSESTVYNTSIEFDSNSPKVLKRSAVDDNGAPNPKRTRSSANSTNSRLRSTPARTLGVQRVLFTAFPSDEVKLQLENLGAIIVPDVMECSMVLTMQIKRTFKLLCAVGLGRPIVGPNWVQVCVDTKMIVDPWLYIIKDEAAEKRFTFNLESTLKGKRNFLEGYNVSSTPNVSPSAPEMKLIVECSGGKWKEEGPRWICVSSPSDKALWPSLKRKGAVIVTTEFILAGVLKQKVDIGGNQFK